MSLECLLPILYYQTLSHAPLNYSGIQFVTLSDTLEARRFNMSK